MPRTCPCCGQPMPNKLGAVLSETGTTLRFRDATVRLTATEGRFVRPLLERAGREVSRDAIFLAMHGHRPDVDWPEEGTVAVYALRVRRKLEPVGLSIATVWGSGYRLEAVNA